MTAVTLPATPPALTEELLTELAALAAEVARSTGILIRDLREAGVDVAASKSSATDIVTVADRRAEEHVVAAISAARPHDGILGEEGAGVPGTSGITWVVDPIDGTVNYAYGIPLYAVSIAATIADPTASFDGRRAVAGAVFAPRTDELFEAHEGGGARLNGEPIRVSDCGELAMALVATGFGYTVERRTEQAEMAMRLIPRARDLRRTGSAAYDLCSFASGRIDAYYERGLQPWDYAAGLLIAREAGGDLAGIDAATPPGEPMLVAAPAVLMGDRRTVVRGK